MKIPVLHKPFRKVLLLLILALFAISCASVKTEPSDPTPDLHATPAPATAETEAVDPAPDLRAILVQATGELEGDYEMLALSAEIRYGNVFNEHIAYAILCRLTGIPDADPRLATVVIDVTDQCAELLAAETWPITDDAGVALPEPDYVQDLYFGRIADLPAGTAGSSLEAAEQVVNVWLLCARIDFASLEPESVRTILSSTLAGLPPESRVRYGENAPGILSEVRRLLDPQAELSGLYEDAGLKDCLTVLRQEASVRASVEAFLDLAEEAAIAAQ